MRFFTFLWTALLSVLLVSCTADSTTPIVETKQELATPSFQAVAFPEGFGIHGIDATRHLWFAAVAYPPSVRVARRLTGTVLGSLPAPAGGFGAPVAVRVASDGRVLVLDGVTTPQLAGTAPAVLYEYAVTPTLSGFSATLLASHTLPLIGVSEFFLATAAPEPRAPVTSGIFYPIMMTTLPDGSVAVTDTVAGNVWLSDTTRSTWRNALQDPRLRPVPHAPIVGKGRGGDYVFDVSNPPGVFPGAFGLAYLAATDEIVLANPSQGGLWALPFSVFTSTADPTTKSASVRPLVAAPILGVTDLVAGLDTNRWDATDPYVYFQRVAADAASDYKNVLSRVHAGSGAVEVLARSSTDFDFDVAVSVVEPLLPCSFRLATVGSGIGQEENNPFVNATIGGVPRFVVPTLISAVVTTY